MLHGEHQKAVNDDPMLVIVVVVRPVARRSVMGMLFVMPRGQVTLVRVAHRFRHKPQIPAAKAAKPQWKAENLRHEQQQNCTPSPGS